MGLLDTFVKLQAIKQQEQQAQLSQINTVMSLVDAARRMKDMDTEERFNTAISGVSPDITTQRPGAGITGMEEYDVPDPTQMISETTPKTDEQYYGDLAQAGMQVSTKHALPFLTAKRGAAKERQTEERRRAENPIVPFELGEHQGTAALSNVTPIITKREALDQKIIESDRQEQYRQDKLAEDKRHRQTLETIRQTSGEKPPKAPTGYRYDVDGELEPIPGGKDDTKRRESYAKAEKNLSGISSGLDTLKKQAQKLKDHKGLSRITGITGKFPNIPGSDAANAEALLEQLKSRTGLDTLQNMRLLSPTGGALGNVSDAEGKRLEAYIAALQKAQSTPALKDALQDIISYVDTSKKVLHEGFEQTFSEKDKARYGGKKGQPTQQTPSISREEALAELKRRGKIK
jgi:hypothetical protein